MVAYSDISCLGSETNKFTEYFKMQKLAPQVFEEEYAIGQKIGDNTYRFTVEDFNYNDLFPVMYIESTVIHIPPTSNDYFGDAYEQENLQSYFSNAADVQFIREDGTTEETFWRDFSNLAIRPCPFQRAAQSATVQLGESIVPSLPASFMEDLCAIYSNDMWDVDMGLAGAGTLGYGKNQNTTSGYSTTVLEPVIMWPQLFGGESATGLFPVAPIASLNKFIMEFNIANKPRDLTWLSGISVDSYVNSRFMDTISEKAQFEIQDAKLIIRKYMPNVSLLNLLNETRRLCPFVEAFVYDNRGPDKFDGKFDFYLNSTTVQWEKMFVRAYAELDTSLYQVPVPINSLCADTVVSSIGTAKNLTYERLQQITKKNGYGMLKGNNSALNTIGEYGVCIDFNDLELNKNTGITANTIINQTWRLKGQAGGEVWKAAVGGVFRRGLHNADWIIVHLLHYGTADVSDGTYRSEKGLWSAEAVATVQDGLVKRKDPLILESAKDGAMTMATSLGNNFGDQAVMNEML